jgi:hypothetical protein
MRCEDTTLVVFSLQDIPTLGFCATTGVNIRNTEVLSSTFKVVFCIWFNFDKGKSLMPSISSAETLVWHRCKYCLLPPTENWAAQTSFSYTSHQPVGIGWQVGCLLCGEALAVNTAQNTLFCTWAGTTVSESPATPPHPSVSCGGIFWPLRGFKNLNVGTDSIK